MSALSAAAAAKVGSYLELRGARVEMLQTSMRLLVPSTGSIEAADGQSFKPKVCVDAICVACLTRTSPNVSSILRSDSQTLMLIAKPLLQCNPLQTDFNLSDLDFELVLVPRPGEVPAAQPGRSAAESDKADTAPVSDEDKQEVASDVPIEDGFEAALDPTDD